MNPNFEKLMRKQIQDTIDHYAEIAHKPIPKKGWVKTIREALGMSSEILAKRLSCSRSNITTIEQREIKGTISLETLERVAQAMNCKLVYCLVPQDPLEILLKKQARIVAKKRIQAINQSMKLEQQGLTKKQLQQQEDDLVEELLQGKTKHLWADDEI